MEKKTTASRTKSSTDFSNQEPPNAEASGRDWAAELARKDARIAELESRLKLQRELEMDNDELRAKVEAQSKSLEQTTGAREDGMEYVDPIVWCLVWLEYCRRTKLWQFVGEEALRSKVDKHGNYWKVANVPVVEGMTGSTRELFMQVAQAFGYDPMNPPTEDFIFVECVPQKGTYDIACQNIEKAQAAYRMAHKQLLQIEAAQNAAADRGDQEKARLLSQQRDEAEAVMRGHARTFSECQAVIESQVQWFYMIPMASLENKDMFGMDVQMMKATLIPQKKHEQLIGYKPREEVVAPQHG